MESVRIESRGLLYPAVYAPSAPLRESIPPRFSVSTIFDDLPEELRREIFSRGLGRRRNGILTLKSPRRFHVIETGARYTELADLFRLADAANVTRDALLRGVPTTINAEWAEVRNTGCETHPSSFDVLVPLSIAISLDDLKLPS